MERADIALGGAERSVVETAGALSGRGLDVDILAAKGRFNTRSIHILGGGGGKRAGYYAFGKTLKRYLAENHYDIVHSVLPFEFADVYQPRGGTYAESIIRNAASFRSRLMKSYKRLTALANFRRTALKRAERRLCQNAKGPVIAALSQYVAEQLKEHYGTSVERIAVIHNGVKTDKRVDGREADRLRRQILTQLGLKESDNPVLFMFVANNFRLKGLGVLIEAMSRVTGSRGGGKSCLVVAGSGGTARYRHTARRLKVEYRTVFLGPIRHIQNALSIVDVAVLPTFYDPSSRYILEALAAGKPVITTRFNGATDLFTAERHGKVVESPEDIPALAAAISHFTEPDNVKKASEAIKADQLKERVSVGRVAEQLVQLYESIQQRRVTEQCT